MNNQIDLHIEFSFKGEDYVLTTTLDLDALELAGDALPDFHQLLAQANGIDTYSYLYEVMESHDIVFRNATGIAAECLHDGVFDGEAFRHRRHAAGPGAARAVAAIARQHLNIDDLNEQPALRQALLAAYNAGKAAAT